MKVISKIFQLALATISLLTAWTIFNQIPSSATAGVTVTFVANDGQIPIETASQISPGDGSYNLTTFAVLFPQVVYTGHTFAFWSTQQGGGGTTYFDGASYPFLNGGPLYAQWIGPSHTVTFAENINSGDPTETAQVANEPTSLTLFSNLSVKFSNPNHMFAGWNTAPDGSGTSYADGSIYNFSAPIILYAQWTPNTETITFSSNTGDGSVPTLSAPYGSYVTIPPGTPLAKVNYSFVGWNTMPDGSGASYQPGSLFSVQAGGTLYAMWKRETYVVSFDIPGLKGSVAPISVLAGNSIILRSSSNLVDPGYTFAGWYTSPVGGRLVGVGGAMFQPTSTTSLYARWLGNPLVTLEFSDNGGVGHITALTAHRGLAVTIPGGSALHRVGYTFRGWASNARASAPSVRIGVQFVVTHAKVLYALWRRDLPPSTPQVLLGSVGIFAPNSSSLTPAMRRFVASLAMNINGRNRTRVLLYGYATSKDASAGSVLLSLARAVAVEKQLNLDLAGLNDVGVTVRARGEGRLTNSVLASFRNVEVFAN